MKLNQFSLATRNALIYFILFTVGLGVSSYILFSYSAKEILSLTEENLEHNGDLVALQFDSYLYQVETDLDQLASSPLLQHYINEPNRRNLDLITEEYQSFLKSKQSYFQVRLLSENSGDELIRVERNNNRIYAADFTDLQNKKDRDYFLEIVDLENDSIYFSKIDLNREYDTISYPVTPTLRIARLLKTDSLGSVIVIINVDLNPLFRDLNNSLPDSYELRIVNQEGHYLIHPNNESAFTFEYNLAPVYAKEFSESPQEIMAETALFTTDKSISKFKKLDYKRNNYELIAIISAQNDTIFASFYSWRKKVLIVVISIAVFFLFIAFMYLRRQVRELKTITNELMSFTDHHQPQKLAIDRTDEIGQLARGFELMSNRVSESYTLIEKARNEAQQAFEEKNEFLENMSHEIRNPLQSILGTVQILEQNELNTNQIPYVNALKFSANQLKSLVTDVLDYGKIKRNQIVLHAEWINLDDFCNDLIKALKHQAISNGVELKYEVFEGIDASIYKLDSTRFYQVLNNLIMNALKFTDKGGCVNLSIEKIDKGHFHFKVVDNGKGISRESIRQIVDRSYTSDYVTGVGLGLTIVQRLLALSGASLEIESELGKGSQFHFILPIETKERNQIVSSKASALWMDESVQPRIAILEDDPALMDWYHYIFEGVDALFFTNPSELKQNDYFNLIISDLNFVGNDYQVKDLEVSLSQYLTSNGQLIFVSGEAIQEDVGVEIWVKPIPKTRLSGVINKIFCLLNYGTPNFENIEKDYDKNKALITNALNVLAGAWRKDQNTLVEAIANRDLEKFDQIKHRIITSVRRMELFKFEDLLTKISQELMIMKEDDLAHFGRKIDGLFDYLIEAIESYNQLD